MTLLEGVGITRHVDVSLLLQNLSQFLQKLGRVIAKHIKVRQVMALVIKIVSLYLVSSHTHWQNAQFPIL